jgi:hypothetical protein
MQSRTRLPRKPLGPEMTMRFGTVSVSNEPALRINELAFRVAEVLMVLDGRRSGHDARRDFFFWNVDLKLRI